MKENKSNGIIIWNDFGSVRGSISIDWFLNFIFRLNFQASIKRKYFVLEIVIPFGSVEVFIREKPEG